MALPAGISTATVTVGVPVTFSGLPVKTNITITPSAFLVHTATGHPLVNMIEEATANDGVAVQFTLPHTDQAGFQDEAGNAYQNWYYTATIQYQMGKVTKPAFTKVFQLAVGQTTVDLDLLPSGSPAMPYTAPVATVTSVNGSIGAVTIDKTTVGLGNVDNTSDASKPVSTAQATALATKAPIVRKGTLATRPATPGEGTEWIQTDAAGGNLPGTRTYFDGAVWSSVAPNQIAQVGCQSNNWFTTMPDPNPPATQITFASLNAGANGVSLSLFRLTKDMTVASLTVRKGTGTANYSQAIYRLDGTTLTQVATTGDLVNPNIDNNIRRDPLLATVTLTAGTTYYYALTAGTGTFQYYQRTGGSIHTANMVGLVFGDATALYQSAGAFHPAPASIDTAVGTWVGWQNPPVHFGLTSV